MADVSKVKGNINQPEPDKARDKSEPDVEELREKWAKVGKVDPDEKKERKPKAQEEAETRQKQTTEKKPALGASEPSIFEPNAPKAPAPSQGAEGAQPPPPTQTPQAAQTAPETPETEEPQEGEQTAPTQKKKKAETMGKEALQQTTETGKPKQPEKTEKKPKTAEVIAPEPLPPPPLAQGAWEATGKETDIEKKKDKEEPTAKLPTQIQQAPQDMPQSPGGPAISDITTTPALPPLQSPFANLPPQVQQLFEKMVGVMTVMNTTGVQETTISLNNPQFEKSIFYGAEIVITEFSSAPKAFNIELRGSENAMNLFAENSQRILDEIQKNDYNFTVTRIDTSYLPKSKEEKRKESGPVKRKRST